MKKGTVHTSLHEHTWWAGACEIASFTPLSHISAGAIVATRSVVAGIEFLTKDSCVAILTLAKESALQKQNHTHTSFLKSMNLKGETLGNKYHRKKNL